MRVLDLPIEQVLEAALPDVNTDPTLSRPDPTWLRSRQTFEIEGEIDKSEFLADLIQSCSGLSR
ncbi:MAG: hypothetical protein M3161_00765 [Actinomycetota bacterium]|nr:hypothetical protein [Actinomycetota bacterium]